MLKGTDDRVKMAEQAHHYYLSFDCGNRALGYVLLRIAGDVAHVNGYVAPDGVDLAFIDYGVVDLLGDTKLKDTDEIYRVKQLKKALDKIDIKGIPADKLTVLVEYQMGPNVKSHSVFDGIFMYYADYDIQKVGPSLKNKLYFVGGGKHQDFMAKYARSYTANKAHTAYNMEQFAAIKKIDISRTNKKYLKDLGDAFMQCIAWVIVKKGGGGL